MPWGRPNVASRQEQVARSLAKITVKVGRRERVKVDPGVAQKLSAYSDRTSQRVLAWAARQAMLMHREQTPGSPLGPDRRMLLAEEFVLGFEGVLDFSEVALVLSPDGRKASRVNLLAMTGPQAWEAQDAYHTLLSEVDDDGKLEIPKGWTALQTAAMIGVSPGMLKQVNVRGVERLKHPSKLWVTKPAPLQHRYVLVEYNDGFAWVWIKPGIDKDRVGRNIGLCINANGWDKRLQFALVDPENRPWAVLTMQPKLLARGVPHPSPNDLVKIHGDGTSGTVELRIAEILRRQILMVWGECKGRFNKRPVPDPHRRYAVALITSGVLGPLNVPPSSQIAAADLASLLLVDLKPSKARALWKKAGGEASVFSVADALRPSVMGDGGPNEKTLTYFDAALPDEWLKTALAPLLLATLSDDELQVVWNQQDGRTKLGQQIRSEIMRQVGQRKITDRVFWQTQIAQADRLGVHVPPGDEARLPAAAQGR